MGSAVSAANMNESNALAAFQSQAPSHVTRAIHKASTRTGVDFSYLMDKAKAESSFNPDAKARTSSATGLFQFIESTWLSMVKKHGAKHGMGNLADKIDGNNRVSDPDMRQHILDLRKDPEKAALLAAEFAAENKAHLERHVGGDVGTTELYFAHFMGAGGATKFLNAFQENPSANAAALFPKEARANKGVFYNADGSARSMSDVYHFFDKKFSKIQMAEAPVQENSLSQSKKSSYRPLPPSISTHTLFEDRTINDFIKILYNSKGEQNWQGFGAYSKLSLSPSELMLLSQFEWDEA